jgi:hypothetical protein
MTARNDDVVDVLLAQHQGLRQRFAALRAAVGSDRKTLFDDLVRFVHVHEIGEQAVVYPAARDAATGANTIAAECAREEDQIAQKFAEIKELGVGHPAFDTKLALLNQALLDHIAREEHHELPRLRRYLPKARLYTMAAELHDVQAMR